MEVNFSGEEGINFIGHSEDVANKIPKGGREGVNSEGKSEEEMKSNNRCYKYCSW